MSVRYNSNLDMLPPYLFADMDRKRRTVQESIARGEGKYNSIIPLAVGDPDLSTPQPIIEAMKKDADNYHGYPDYEGLPELRQAIVDYYGRRAEVSILPNDVSVSMGAKTDLFDFVRAFSNPGDIVLVQDPAYPVYVNSTIIDGRELKFWPSGDDTIPMMPSQFLSRDDLQRLAVVYICNPNNPTGKHIHLHYMKEYVEDAMRTKDIVGRSYLIVHDIAYWDFKPGGTPFVHDLRAPSIFEIDGAKEVAIECGSFSKPYSMTDKRLSWVIGRRDIGNIWGRYRTNRDSGVTHSIQMAGVEALKNPAVEEEVKANMGIYGERARVLVQGLRKLGLQCNDLEFTPYVWARVPESFTSASFAEHMLENAYVGVTPGSGFGKEGEGFIRVTVFKPVDVLQEALYRMEKSL